MGQVYAVASGKGGVGKTTTVVNLGVVLRRADHSVALVDADLGMANLGTLLGIDGERTLHDVLAGEATVEDALVEEAAGFAVLVGSGEVTAYPDADPRGLGDVLGTLAEAYDVVLVDTGAGMSHEDVLPLGLADRVILVASPDRAAIGDTRKTAELVGLAGGTVAGLLVTKADAATDAKHVASQVGVELLGVVPYDPTVRESTASGRPLEAVDPEIPSARAYRELAATLTGEPVEPAPGEPVGEPGPEGPSTTGGTAAEPEPADGPEPADPPVAGPDGDREAEAVAGADDGAGTPTAGDEAGGDTSEDVDAVDVAATAESEDAGGGEDVSGAEDGTETEDDEDPIAAFEDDESGSGGGLLSRLGRLFH